MVIFLYVLSAVGATAWAEPATNAGEAAKHDGNAMIFALLRRDLEVHRHQAHDSERRPTAPADELDDDDRARLHAALDASQAEIDRGEGVPASEVIAELRNRDR